MSGQDHKSRTGWVYGPRPRGTCVGCGEPKTLDTQGLVINHRERRDGRPGPLRCTGSGHLPDPKDPIVTEPGPDDPDDPGAQDECATCGHRRYRHQPDQPDGHGANPCQRIQCACQGEFVELSQPTRMARLADAAQDVARSIRTLADSLESAMRATSQLYTAMQAGGLIPEEHEPEEPPGRHAARIIGPGVNQPLMNEIHAAVEASGHLRAEALDTLAAGFDVPQDAITGPPPDGLPDHWPDAAPVAHWRRPADECTHATYIHQPHFMPQPDGDAIPCPGLGPAQYDPGSHCSCPIDGQPLAEIHYHLFKPTQYLHTDGTHHLDALPDLAATTMTIPAYRDADTPHLCDGCGRTDRPVTATDDGRALACPDCLPAANNLINNYCPDCRHPWSYATGTPPNCCMPVKPGTTTPVATSNEPSTRCGCATQPPPPRDWNQLYDGPPTDNPNPKQADPAT